MLSIYTTVDVDIFICRIFALINPMCDIEEIASRTGTFDGVPYSGTNFEKYAKEFSMYSAKDAAYKE